MGCVGFGLGGWLAMEATDGRFTLVAHALKAGLLDIVDEEWAADKLPDDEIQIPPDHDVPSEDEVEEAEGSKNKADKWTELGLHQLENA